MFTTSDTDDDASETAVSQRDEKHELDDWERQYDDWHEEFGDENPYEEDDEEKPRPDEVPASDYERDEHGSYNPAGGAQSQQAALKAGRCGAKLRYAEERYGEPRYCTRLPVAVFVDGGSERCYEHRENDSDSAE